ncbi:MAG: serine/threonine protein kinase [Candidatus Competibacteraceae bacterium]|nr:serine/threonine protein kinase [Candidatus Competibacteraceae bacterium]
MSEPDTCHDQVPILKERPPELVEREAEASKPELVESKQAKQEVKQEEEQEEGEKAEARSQTEGDLPQFPQANFKLIEVLGEGGMGTVYRVRDENLQVDFAVKVLRPELARDRNLVSRFKREAEAAGELSHANLATIYKTGECLDGRPYLVMDYVPGPSLATVLQQEGHLRPERALEIFIQICEVVEYAHSKGVIHRDLKPSNVLLVKEDNLERIKLVDFGIARVLPHISGETLKLTTADQVLGSPLYMSPEQCQGDELGRQSDIYSLGCLMYEALTGRVPFLGENSIKTILKHLNEEPAHLTVHLKSAELPRGLSPVVLKCLEKRPGIAIKQPSCCKET